MSLNVKTVLVTGASRGLGFEFIKQLLQSPTPPEIIIAACRDPSNSSGLEDIAKLNKSIKLVQLDVENDDTIEKAVAEVAIYVGEKGLNLLINNAGIFDTREEGSLKNVKRDVMLRHYNVNVAGPVMVAQKFLPLLQKAAALNPSETLSANRAAIVMISALLGSQALIHGENVYGHYLHYKCSKTALNMATILMSSELKTDGILVTAIHPGWVRTDMGTSAAPLGPEESIRGCIEVIAKAGNEINGRMVEWNGKVLPF